MKLPDQRVTHVSALYDERELKTSPTYNDLLRKAECHDSLHVRMNGPDGLDIVLVFCGPGRRGRVGVRERAGHRTDRSPHPQFVRVRHALAGAEGLAASLADLLGNLRSTSIRRRMLSPRVDGSTTKAYGA